MLAEITAAPWHWGAFLLAVVFFLALDLGVFHRHAHVVKFKEALGWTCLWFTLAMVFGLLIGPKMIPGWAGPQTEEFITGYIIELALSMDNVFVIALIFGYFGVKREYQHRVLFWGILGALIMRGLMIWIGAGLVERFQFLLYILGAFLIFTGVKMLFADDEEVEPEKNIVVRLTRRFFPVSPKYDGQNFTTVIDGKKMLTPMALVLVMVETTDLIFAVDSIPAIFAITTEPFLVFTSNVFAILGLRSLYFVLEGAINYFRYLKIGLSIVLIFIGLKMVMLMWKFHIPTRLSLIIVATIIFTSIAFSVLVAKREEKHRPHDDSGDPGASPV
ncbi:MAG TPA: TerC family protein [Methylomirabilota bacterium]|nr:TerC family protein [Methylomirabilota bacterium]